MNLPQLFEQEKQELTKLSALNAAAKERAGGLEEECEGGQEEAEKLEKVVALLRSFGVQARNIVTDVVDPLAEQALCEVFGPQSEFHTIFKELPKGGFSARIVSGIGDQVGSPLATDGGSVAEVLGDAVLRPMVVCLHHPELNRIVILDEPFAGVDEERAEALAAFLQRLSKDMGIQFIITTHEMGRVFDQYADEVIEL